MENLNTIKGSSILLVEDNEFNQQIASELLTDAGFKVDIAENGQKSIEMLDKRSYDIVLMDMQMPVMDGTTAGNGPGPRLMQPVVKNVILASADQVAIDAVAAKLMGFDPLEIKYIRLAHEQGLGVGDMREIEMVGDDVSGEDWGFKVGYCSHTFLAWLSWYGPTKVLQKLLFRTPLVVVPTLIGEVEQDYLYWPLKYKGVAAQWRMNTTWGQLFQRYQREGFLIS